MPSKKLSGPHYIRVTLIRGDIDMQDLLTLRQAAKTIGISYDRLWYACITKRICPEYQAGGTRLFTYQDAERAKEYFASKEREEIQ
jgi:hypothetical protein